MQTRTLIIQPAAQNALPLRSQKREARQAQNSRGAGKKKRGSGAGRRGAKHVAEQRMRRTKNSKKTEVCGSKNKVVTNLRGLGLNQYTVPGSITLQSTTDGLDVKDWKN